MSVFTRKQITTIAIDISKNDEQRIEVEQQLSTAPEITQRAIKRAWLLRKQSQRIKQSNMKGGNA
jgi:hypothetical protein